MVSMEDILTSVEQVIVLLGQCSNTLLYHRRFSLLSELFPSMSHTKELLLEKLTLLQKHDSELFGKKFRERFIEVRISKKKT